MLITLRLAFTQKKISYVLKFLCCENKMVFNEGGVVENGVVFLRDNVWGISVS